MTSRLVELAVTDLGIIESMSLVLGPGVTALTGETGAGKTMVVGAIDLLLGGRADAGSVRTGADEAIVEGRFDVDGDELVLTRVVPRSGRSRAYVNGRMATAAALAEAAAPLVDLHGQNAHQSLLGAATQRAALDQHGGLDLGPLSAARDERRRLESELAGLGGDAGARAREVDLLRYQLAELDAAALTDADEDLSLDAEEDRLGATVAHREAAAVAVETLAGEGGVVELLAEAIADLDDASPFATLVERLRGAEAELADAAAEIRRLGESIEDDPERLAAVRERRQLLVELRRKYGTVPDADGVRGSGALADVLAHHRVIAERLDALERHDERAATLEADLAAAVRREADAARVVGAARREEAPRLADAVEGHLRALAMGSARLEIRVGDDDPGDDVTFLLAANPGSDPAPLAKVASGGELARTMLALRLVLSSAPPVLVFDEVDAGIGGSAALAVGRSLAALGVDHQVLVVTHLPQVAAYADHQVHVAKDVRDGRTTTSARALDAEGRVRELSRMLAGAPESERVQDAASELLAEAARERGR